jgi:hypothetical protein
MILPSKHINFSQSLLGLGAFILSQLESPKTVDELWENYLSAYQNKDYPAKQSFDNLIMTLLFLYSIDRIIEKKGMIIKCV